MQVDQVPKVYKDRKKRVRYEMGVKRYKQSGICKKDAVIYAFVKAERYVFNPEKRRNDPRVIQFRTPQYVVALAQYLRPYEHMLYPIFGLGMLGPLRSIGKGLNLRQRGQLIHEKWQMFQSPKAIGIDASRFDKHVSREMLQIEHCMYKMAYKSAELNKLLDLQLNNHCRTLSRGQEISLKYVTRGRRMSGDVNTGLGNSLITMLIVFHSLQGFKFQTMIDGDDAVIITERRDSAAVKARILECYGKAGMDLRVDWETTIFERINWCQTNPVRVGGQYIMIRSPAKALRLLTSGTKYLNEKISRRLFATIGMGEGSLSIGVPILQSYAACLRRSARGATPLDANSDESMFYRYLGLPNTDQLEIEIDSGARCSFALAFDITISQQLAIESYFSNLLVYMGEIETVGYCGPDDLPQRGPRCHYPIGF
jgi:hypothetical protein